MLFRKISRVILEHLTSQGQPILLVDGANQMGETYIICYIGKLLFENLIEINMLEESLGPRLFAQTD